MSNITIYTDGDASYLENICRTKLNAGVTVKNSDEIQNMETEEADASVIDVSKDKIKELSMIMKFTLPVLLICDKIPDDMTN